MVSDEKLVVLLNLCPLVIRLFPLFLFSLFILQYFPLSLVLGRVMVVYLGMMLVQFVFALLFFTSFGWSYLAWGSLGVLDLWFDIFHHF